MITRFSLTLYYIEGGNNMAATQNVFKRYEQKYMLSKNQYESMLTFLSNYMEQDCYGLHTICNIYYDTNYYNLIRTSLEKPIYKEKFRVRSYGQITANDHVFLEIKKKYKGVVYKRRESMMLSEADAYLQYDMKPKKQGQILHEIDWFLNLNDISPKVYIAYDRLALFSKDDETLRVTFDHNIRFRDYDLDLTKNTYGRKLINDDRYLMELKMSMAMPKWLSDYLAVNNILPTSFSKYGTCYKEFIFFKELGKSKLAIHNGVA